MDYNHHIGDGGIMYLSNVMKKVKGAMQHLQELGIRSVDTTIKAAAFLCGEHALGDSHICPNLDGEGT